MGLPVVSFDITAINPMVEHNGHRVVFASDNPAELIQAVDDIEKNGLSGFIPELNCAYERYYSKKALIGTLRRILE